MTIFLMILKVIGWILLAVLGLVLLVAALILFVPIRYRLRADAPRKNVMDIQIEGDVTWLLRIVRIHAYLAGLRPVAELRILWIRRVLLGETETESGSETKDEVEDEDDSSGLDIRGTEDDFSGLDIRGTEDDSSGLDIRGAEDDSSGLEDDSSGLDIRGTEDKHSGHEKTDIEVPSERDKRSSDADLSAGREENPSDEDLSTGREGNSSDENLSARREENPSDVYASFGREENPEEASEGVFSRVQHSVQGTLRRGKEILGNLRNRGRNVKRILEDERNQLAFSHLKREVLYLLRHIVPESCHVDLEYSAGSPDITGILFGVLAMFPIGYEQRWRVEPDFEEDKAYVSGKVDIAGRIRLIHVLISFLRLVFDRNCRRLRAMVDRYF